MTKRDTNNKKESYLILIRYIIIILIIISLPIIYTILSPLTIYPVYFTLDTIYSDVTIENNLITISPLTKIEIVPACIAGSAYLLLLILILSIKMNLKKRIKLIISSILMLL
ncbi:pacearchaeosortase, partial [Candidatus Pacearchaeota archaeon]|nr:pacearchaeosortase [Candidatus Pacearchaeota archaeon]